MFKEDDLVLCTVKRVEGANVFVEIDGGTEASLQLSEIAAGRIRNLREYVSLNKRIVCKVLKIINGYIQLSLRRVTGKERDEMLEKEKKRKVLLAMIKTIVKEPSAMLFLSYLRKMSNLIKKARVYNPALLFALGPVCEPKEFSTKT